MPSIRSLAGSGLAYPVLTVAAFAAFPKPPGNGDVTAANDPVWLAKHTGAVIGQSYVRAVAAVAFVVLAVAVAQRLHEGSRTLPRLVVAGGSAYAGLLLAAQAMLLAAALAARDHVEPTVLRFADSLDGALLALSSLPAILLFAAAGLGLRTSRGVPVWFAGLTLAGAPLAALDAFSYDGGPLAALGLLGLAYFLVWSAVAGVVLLREGRAEPLGA